MTTIEAKKLKKGDILIGTPRHLGPSHEYYGKEYTVKAVKENPGSDSYPYIIIAKKPDELMDNIFLIGDGTVHWGPEDFRLKNKELSTISQNYNI